eukprot:TRINITY_DN40729_c0_g1_i1.p1 TRINITY_DN40729_c0_g1~~TRINITY_DN40729_c0_g1_i1.p1  ORF type:complete len:642 (+),score=187.44 TRINITY_DN40729_c0_g1_i1:58-1926(+)
MEFSFIAQHNISDDTIMSIRAGSEKKQAPLKSGRPFVFSKMPLEENPVRLDLLRPIGTAYLCLKPGGGQYKVTFDGDSEATCELQVQMNEAEGRAEEAVEPSSPKLSANVEAKAYLEAHQVLPVLQSVLQTIVKEKPAEPFAHIARHFANGYPPPPDCPEQDQTEAQQDEAPPKKEDQAQQDEASPKKEDQEPEVSADLLAQLTCMGFEESSARKALVHAGSAVGEAASDVVITAAIDFLTSPPEDEEQRQEEKEEDEEEAYGEESEEEEEEQDPQPEQTAAADEETEEEEVSPDSWKGRLRRLAAHVSSSAVKVQEAEDLEEVPAKLSSEEVGDVFLKYVPGVSDFLYRQQDGQKSLEFIKGAYENGLRAYQETDLHTHFMWNLRLIVHAGHEGKPDCGHYLQQVAEAFMDCQAVQARVIESVGLQMRGVSNDFTGLLVSLATEYKFMAIRGMAYESCEKRGGIDDDKRDPTHLENRFLIDIGAETGFSEADVRRASLDTHTSRWPQASETEVQRLVRKFRRRFDADAMLKAMLSELHSFSEASPPESMPKMFLAWADRWMTDKFVLMDEDTYARIDVEDELGLAVLEVAFFGQPACPPDELYRGEQVHRLFKTREQLEGD